MKKILFNLISAVIVLTMAFSFAGCGEEESTSNTNETKTSSSSSQTKNKANQVDLSSLHTFDKDGDKFAGIWQITDGAGSDLTSFYYMFDGNGKADLITGTSGYCGTYGFDDTLFACQLMFGINGKYTYEISENKIELTNSENKENTTLTRVNSLDMIPLPFADFSVDNNLLGAWKSDNGETYYFDKNGIMYQNQYDSMYTYYSYSAQNGKIKTESYIGNEKNEEEIDYSIEDNILNMYNMQYKKIDASEVK